MKHKHAELIKAWADGATIEGTSPSRGIDWWQIEENPDWANTEVEYRIKPEPKPDMTILCVAIRGRVYQEGDLSKRFCQDWPNLQLTFDGETGQLKSAEVLK